MLADGVGQADDCFSYRHARRRPGLFDRLGVSSNGRVEVEHCVIQRGLDAEDEDDAGDDDAYGEDCGG